MIGSPNKLSVISFPPLLAVETLAPKALPCKSEAVRASSLHLNEAIIMTEDEAASEATRGECPTCGGKGTIPKMTPVRPGEPMVETTERCPDCDGAGRKRKL
jgi:hypothetical protein